MGGFSSPMQNNLRYGGQAQSPSLGGPSLMGIQDWQNQQQSPQPGQWGTGGQGVSMGGPPQSVQVPGNSMMGMPPSGAGGTMNQGMAQGANPYAMQAAQQAQMARMRGMGGGSPQGYGGGQQPWSQAPGWGLQQQAQAAQMAAMVPASMWRSSSSPGGVNDPNRQTAQGITQGQFGGGMPQPQPGQWGGYSGGMPSQYMGGGPPQSNFFGAMGGYPGMSQGGPPNRGMAQPPMSQFSPYQQRAMLSRMGGGMNPYSSQQQGQYSPFSSPAPAYGRPSNPNVSSLRRMNPYGPATGDTSAQAGGFQ